jgi:hypothetical protein
MMLRSSSQIEWAATAHIGVYYSIKEQNHHTDLFIVASSRDISSPLQAEAQALLLGGKFVAALSLASPVFFDCSNLAKVAAAPGTGDQFMLWDIRRWSIEFTNNTSSLQPRIFYISREINNVAHNCAQQTRRSFRPMPTCSCRSS